MDFNFAINDITNYLVKNGISKISSVVINSMTFSGSFGNPIAVQVNSGNLLTSYNYTSINSSFFTVPADVDYIDWQHNGVTITITLTITTTSNQTYDITLEKTIFGDHGSGSSGGER